MYSLAIACGRCVKGLSQRRQCGVVYFRYPEGRHCTFTVSNGFQDHADRYAKPFDRGAHAMLMAGTA
jgi:hypothetical protein